MNIYYTNEEQVLVKRCIQGDQQAQMQLYRRYVQAMFNTVIRMVPQKMDAEDILQESFGSVFSQLSYFKGNSSLGAWVKRITINTTLNYIRKNQRFNFQSMETTPELSAQLEPTVGHDWDLKRIHQAIKTLPTGCRTVFNLYLLEGYQHKEIADILNISESTSKSQYKRAKSILQQQLNRITKQSS